MAEVYYVMSGSGTATVGSETAAIKEGDAIAVQLNETHTLQIPGTAPLELLIVGVSRERNKETQ